uniref:Putative ribonuclease H-like domain-containing protein n=1 Tax=Tanacetum cinerariifolium TaxID=118510 RepID=A0A6L2JRY3_TANCI|nr:putative ribonuclease H-like domain-containing protein [Tanacetum cinerariifolium]
MMKGSDIGEHEKKAKLFNEWEKFTSTDGESIESYYHRFMQLMNELKRNKHFPENIASNLKFLNNLQPEWKRHITIVRQTKNLHEADFTQIYDFLKMNQDENFMQPTMTSLEDNNDPTEAMNATLILFAKAFQLTAPTDYNQRTSSNPLNRQIAQLVMNISQDRQIHNVGGNESAATWNREHSTWDGREELFGTVPVRRSVREVVWDEGMELVILLLQGLRILDLGIKPGATIAKVWVTLLGIALPDQGEGMLLIFGLTCIQLDKAPVYDTDGSAEVQLNDNCHDNEIFNMFTQEEQYTDILEPIPEPQLVPHNDNHVTSVAPSMVQSGGTVETSSTPNEETRAHQENVYRNLVNQVAQVNMVNCNKRVTNAELKSELARYKIQELCVEISQDRYDKLEKCYQKSVYQEQCLTKKINALHLSSDKQITTLNDEISNLNKQLSKEKSYISSLMEEKKKLKHDFKTREGKFLDKKVDLEAKVKDLENILLKRDQTVQTMHMLNPKADSFYHPNQKIALGVFVPQTTKSKEELFLSNVSNMVTVSKMISIPNEDLSDDTTPSVARKFLNEVKSSLVTLQRVVKQKMTLEVYNWSSSAHKELRARVFENIFESMKNTSGTSVTLHVDKPKLSAINPYSKKLHASISSHSVPHPREFNVVKHRNVIAPGMFKTNPSQTPRVDLVPNKQSSASIRINPITNSQRHVNVKENVSSNKVTASSIGLVHTARTRRPQPKGNTRNARVPSASKSSEVKKNVTVEDHRRTLFLSMNQKTMLSKCNNIKLAIQNDKSKIVCDTCKQCLVTANHDACLPSSVNALNSRENKLCANVPLSANQRKHMTHVWKPKQVGSKERLAYKHSLPRLSLKWSPSRRNFDLKGKLVTSKETNCPNDDKACTSNPQEPMRKRFPNSTLFLDRVYFVEGLGHNLFLVGQFCDANLEVAFRRNTCFIRDLDGVDLLKGNRSTNLYTINLCDMASASPICLMARATPTKSWLWHQRLSRLNFDTINDLAKNDLVSGLPMFKYAKEYLCPSCKQGKSKRASHPPKHVPNSKQRLHLLHIDLHGLMRAASINGKGYVLVIVDDYSRYTWVHFLKTKDETPEVTKNFLKKIFVRLQALVIIVRTDNRTEFKNHVLKGYFDSVRITHETSAAKTPQQNGVVERRNCTLVEAARTMLIFSHSPLFLWAEAIATVC